MFLFEVVYFVMKKDSIEREGLILVNRQSSDSNRKMMHHAIVVAKCLAKIAL